jgi:diacylglycerol O-acyltransferase
MVVLRAPAAGRRTLNDAPRPPALGELGIGLLTFALYVLVEGLGGPGREDAAQQTGRALLAIEKRLHIPVEVWLNTWLTPHALLRLIADYEYAFTYIVTALWLLVWLYRRRPNTYRWARSSFVLLNIIALACFALYPVAPPRLLAGTQFVDTVSADGTWGSWGSPVVARANQLAAMPSLHIAWALWVSVVLACISGRWWVQALSAWHVTVTAVVIMATANHFVLDAFGGAFLVFLAIALMSLVRDRPGTAPRVAGADAFFLYVESSTAPQHVGGLVVLDDSGQGFRDRLRATIETHVDELPRFRQRLSASSGWRRPRWLAASEVDWDWHVPVWELDGGGMAALHDLVARIQAAPLPRDRPLWRFGAVTGFAPGKVAALLVVHHTVADGIGTIAQAFRLIEPVPSMPSGSAHARRPGPLRRAAATVSGLLQLAADGATRCRLPTGDSAERRYVTLAVELSTLRAIARTFRVRVSDVLLTAVGGAVRRLLGPATVPPYLRTAVPLMMRVPDSAAEGNATAAVIIDLPWREASEVHRLQETARRSRRLRTGSRALAARFVMSTGCAVLPPPMLAWFARTVYGHRFFQAIVSNMPGPVGRYRLAGATMEEVYPVLPLAPRVPLAAGIIGWDGTLFFGVSADPALVADADLFAAALLDCLDELSVGARAARATLGAEPPDRLVTASFISRVAPESPPRISADGRLQASASRSWARPLGESNVDPNSV